MEPSLREGDIILLDSAAEPIRNDVVAVWISSEGGTLKRWHPLKVKNPDTVELRPDNPAHKIRMVKLEDIHLQGVVLRLIRRELR